MHARPKNLNFDSQFEFSVCHKIAFLCIFFQAKPNCFTSRVFMYPFLSDSHFFFRNGAGMLPSLLPDLHHKMSKKIAQLTRVIFHLHSRNDQAAMELKEHTGGYEREIDEV